VEEEEEEGTEFLNVICKDIYLRGSSVLEAIRLITQ
jgi:hypothetical protein